MPKIKPWVVEKSKPGEDLKVFKARYDWVRNPRNDFLLKATVLESQDWVNVIAVTDENKFIFVEQYRFGTQNISCELPGGLVDPGEAHQEAAQRELLEETGYQSSDWSYLGHISPNPAVQNNTCHYWLARGARFAQPLSLDQGEDIEVILLNREEIQSCMDEGRIHHILSCFGWLKYINFVA